MTSVLRDYDIIVAGGGLAGMIVASSAAYYSKQSLKILVVDRNPSPQLGRKTISGWVWRCCWKEQCRLHDIKDRNKVAKSRD